ncbi:Polyphosphate kinase [Zhongshania aliphaticivorans]|uniref:Polyphosphate kinase n=1 Tax=Zhongshania aliphaticivorans TaxID=1470434 RepID=A0A5S9N0V6_9GAMM|nr:polyphosphate kinase 1 [Zhongshania aliphaticivorans]CAA0081414.1 Polyphosphate kinase [Zhongshania aliphaticivorans]CAA0085034.1 Polyphosphate kinase [Zhongshania aliphaticivorans]
MIGQSEGATWIAKELSWLSFNERVLQEAADPDVPVIQRIRYLGIFSNNLDEFFRVRVADVRRLAAFSSPSKQEEYKVLLEEIRQSVMKLQHRFDAMYRENLKELRRRKIYLVNEQQLDTTQTDFVRRYFHSHIQQELVPIILDDANPIPELNDASIYLAIKLSSEQSTRFALLEIPTTRLERFIRIPGRKGRRGKVLIALENMIRVCLPDVFRGIFPMDETAAFTIKLTRDADLELGEEVTHTFVEKMTQSLKRRKKGDPVRFVYDSAMPNDLLEYLTKRLGLGRLDSMIPGGRYHNSKDFMRFPNLGPAYLDNKRLPAVPVPVIDNAENILSCLREQDILLHYPYHSFNYLTDLLKTAAIDPQVKSIKASLYRVASNSHVVDALLNAVANHKEVTVVVELQARFDEEANIALSQRLTDGGVNVILGVPGLKVHSKLISIVRQEGNVQKYYSHIGTGNFNEKTATIYTDFSLLTYDQALGDEVAKVFDFIAYNYKRHEFKHLAVSPLNSRDRILELVEGEIRNGKKGLECGITLKCNNLVDRELIDKLYEASSVGVPVRLIVRGMCSLVPGVKGLSENIEAISIVDGFLEHPRVYVFRNAGKPRYFISSADLMTRNIDFRVEVTCPVYSEPLQQTLQSILDLQWADNVKARILDASQSNAFKPRKKSSAKIRSQLLTHKFLSTGKLPRMAKLDYRSRVKAKAKPGKSKAKK